ncbi:MAG: amidohydrolase [Acidaminococcales bacterium]|nr:amidohydrolase [Acidaminococcales bacterium]
MEQAALEGKILARADALRAKTVERRRDLHKYAESGWTELRTAALVADTLTELGYDVLAGDAAVEASAMMGVPGAAVMSGHVKRALSQNANPRWVETMQGGKTGVVGIMRFAQPGATVGLRFDMDANDVGETGGDGHRPNAEGFSSVNAGCMHACGHDGHTAVGLAVAEILGGLKDELGGTIKLIFQPAEEGVRGARAMVEKGVADDIDFMLGAHLGFKADATGSLCCNVRGFLATSKYDAEFTGLAAHAGAAPEAGRNALLAAACAALNLHAIARHGEGASRVNVGILNAGSGRNVLPAHAVLKLETRGATSKINDYMAKEAVRVINAAAQMYGVKAAIAEMGGAAGGGNTKELSDRIAAVAQKLGIFDRIIPECDFGASEDFSYFMERVQKRGGEAAYIMVGADLAAGHHDARFDFDEAALDKAVKLLAAAAAELLGGKKQ